MNDDDEEQEDKKITQRFKHLVCKYVIEKMSTVNSATGNREWQPSRISIPDFEKANKEASEEYSKERDLCPRFRDQSKFFGFWLGVWVRVRG